MSDVVTRAAHTADAGGPAPSAAPTGRLEVRLTGRDPLEAPFAPLAAPELASLVAVDMGGEQVVRCQVSAEAGLRAGRYTLPVTDEEPLAVEVDPETRCRLWLQAAPAGESDTAPTLVTGTEVTFSPGVRLTTVWPVLGRLPAVFEDHDIERLREQFERLASSETADSARGLLRTLWNQWEGTKARWREELPGVGERVSHMEAAAVQAARRLWSGLREGAEELRREVRDHADRLPVVVLERVQASPVLRRGTWRLELRFSGVVEAPRGIRYRFRDVVLPTAILPAPSAVLGTLLSEDPLATAQLRRERVDLWGVLRTLVDLLAEFSADVELALWPPALRVVAPTPNLGTLSTTVSLSGLAELRGHFTGTATDREVRLETSELELQAQGARLRLVGGLGARWRQRSGAPETSGEPGARLAPVLFDATRSRTFPTDRVQAFGWLEVAPGSGLAGVTVHQSLRHRLTEDGSGMTLALDEIALSGRLRAEDPDDPESSWLQALDLDVGAALRLPEGSLLDDGLVRISPEVAEGRVDMRLVRGATGGIRVEAWGRGKLSAGGGIQVGEFPELGIEQGELAIQVGGALDFRVRLETGPLTHRAWTVDLGGTEATLRLHRAVGRLGTRQIALPEGAKLFGRVISAELASSGLGAAHVALGWDLDGRSPVLSDGSRRVEIFVPELRSRSLEMRIGAEGGVTFVGDPGGLYDAHFFNALIRPGAEVERWLEILADDAAMDKVIATAALFSEDGARALVWLRDLSARVRAILDALDIRQPGDFLPARTIARVLSRVLAGDDGLTEDLHAIVKQVTDGHGLDVRATKRILEAHLGDHGFEYELDRGLRIAARLLAPTEPLPPRPVEHLSPLVEREDLAPVLRPLPSAARLYEILSPGAVVSPTDSAAVARVAAYLTIDQVAWLLAQEGGRLQPRDRAWVATVHAVKTRVQDISEHYGGIAFAPQAWAISFFLGAALRAEPPFSSEGADAGGAYALASGVLGPREVAVLLQSGLASLWQGGPVQINLRLLLDYVSAQPPSFCREVLVEMAGRSVRALTGVLYALLHLPQGRMRQPLDVDAWLSERLSLAVPDLADYMAGGRWARESHYEALSRTAELILADATPYFAVLEHLRVVRHPVPAPVAEIADRHALAERAQAAIAEADRLGAECRFSGREPARRRRAVAAYEAAFAACRDLRAEAPESFTRPWFKDFWGRNHEALTVWSVVRNVQQDVDDVRRWLAVRTGDAVPEDEQRLVDAVIDALYYYPEDRERLKADPLVRLLIDPPPGRYDFTIVSAMGVITEGAKGTELKDAYARLEQTRGVRTIRADTRTARSLDFNAARIEEAVRQVTTPWGYIGYSQGCANGLRAESRLLGGTPEQQALARGLVCRNLLFSAANGSAHGTCGDWKFLRAMIDLDHFLKHYQAVFSSRAIDLALRNIGLLLDSRPFVHSMGGVESLSHAGVTALARDGQWRSDVPTSILRGIVEPETLPEALEMLSNVLTHQIESSDHDTQVTITEALGHPVWVRSPMAEVLARCDMGCLVQRTHHWSPLKYATEFVTTERDRALAIYDFPKDRHVVPWVEVNARFGVIRTMDSGR